MKKLVLVTIAAAAAAFAQRKFAEGKAGEAQWHQATDPVRPGS